MSAGTLRRVSSGEFFAALYADKRDIMPSIVSGTYPYEKEWRTQDYRRTLFGKSCGDAWWLVTKGDES